jgi:hypothetical protein
VRLFDRFDDDARGWQCARFFGQAAAERLHELVVDLLTGHLSQQAAHLDDVVLIAATLLGTLLEHRRAARRSAGTTHRRTTRSRRTHAWSRRTRTHRPGRSWAAWAHRSIADACPAWRGELSFELRRSATTAATWATARGRPAPLTAQLVTAVIAARYAATAVTIEAIGVEVFGFEIAID